MNIVRNFLEPESLIVYYVRQPSLLDVPPEVRGLIYQYLFMQPENKSSPSRDSQSTSILGLVATPHAKQPQTPESFERVALCTLRLRRLSTA